MDRNEFEKHAAAYVEGLLNKKLTRALDSQRAADPECDRLAGMHELVRLTLDSVERVKTPAGLTERIVAATGKLEDEYLEEIDFRKQAFRYSFGLGFTVICCGLILAWIVMKGEMPSLSTGFSLSQWEAANAFFTLLAEWTRQAIDFLTRPLPLGIEALKLPVAFLFSFVGSLVIGIIFWLLDREEPPFGKRSAYRMTR